MNDPHKTGATEWRFSAPAKINLDLRVVGRRSDGYHLLSTVMTFIPWCDTVTFQLGGEGLHFFCEPPLGDNPEENIALRAARRMWALAPNPPGTTVRLKKNLPVAAGLGGGSSDGATVLMVLNRLWRVGLSPAALLAEGLRLGADLPVFIGQYASRAEGVGENLTPLPQLPEFAVVVINPGLPLFTKEVFQSYGGGLTNASRAVSITDLLGEKNAGVPLVNDLQPVSLALMPVIGDMLAALSAEGAWLAAMSGSGPTVFGIFGQSTGAGQAAKAISGRYPHWGVFCGSTRNRHPFEQEWQQQNPIF